MTVKRFMLVGRTRCGKTSLCQALHRQPLEDRKTQAVEVFAAAIDTPGEYLENRRFYRALMVSSVDADVIVFMQDCTDDTSMFAPNFATMFSGKPVIGIVSKIDLGTEERIAESRRMLEDAGCGTIIRISAVTGEGLETIREAMTDGE